LLIYFIFFICLNSFLYTNNTVQFNANDTLGLENIRFKSVSINPLIGIPRLLIMPITSFILYCILRKEADYLFIIKIILLCYLFAALTIIYQLNYGPILWFADAHSRGGYVRYASIIGSLTVFGSVAGVAISLIFNSNIVKYFTIKIFYLILIFAATIISLTKTGLVMIMLAFLIFLFFSSIRGIREFFYSILLVIFFGAFIAVILSNNDYFINYLNTVINFTFGNNWLFLDTEKSLINDTPNINIDLIIERLTKYSINSIKYYGDNVFIFGVGVWGGGGVLGYPNEPSAHNGIVDLIIVGGPIYLILFLSIFIRIQFFFILSFTKYLLSQLFFICNIIFFVNMLFISGSLFQPAISILFWISIPYYIMMKQTETNKLIGKKER